MTIQFPNNLDDFTNPDGQDLLDNENPVLDHARQHSDINDAVEALEAKIGINDSADVNSIDYRIRNGGASRKTTEMVSTTLGSGESDTTQQILLGKGGIAVKISTSHPAWVRVYASTEAQTADAARLITTDPTAGTGVLLEVLTSAGALTIVLSPTAVLFSDDGTAYLPVSITNKDSVSREITVIITTVPIEG